LKKIAEFYGATEGNANAINIDNTEGWDSLPLSFLPFIPYP